jgi:hypothetical protein
MEEAEGDGGRRRRTEENGRKWREIERNGKLVKIIENSCLQINEVNAD